MSNSLLRFYSAKAFVILISRMILNFSLRPIYIYIFFFLHSVYLFSLKLSVPLINYESELSLLIKYSQKILAPYRRETRGRKKLSWLFPSFEIKEKKTLSIFLKILNINPSDREGYINIINNQAYVRI